MVRWVVLLLVSLLGAAGCEKQPNAAGATHSVTPFPSISFMTLDGGVIPFESFRGKLVVLNIWATWCPPCREEIPGLIRLQEKFGKDGFLIVGLDNGESAERVASFAKKTGINYLMLLDEDSAVAESYGVVGIPTTFLVASDGRVLGEYHAFTPKLVMDVEKAVTTAS